METFIVKTKKQDKTHRIFETFVVVAKSMEAAKSLALESAHLGAEVAMIREVTPTSGAVRTHISN